MNTWIFIFLLFGLLKALFIIVCEAVHAKDSSVGWTLSCHLNLSSGDQTQVAGLTQKQFPPGSNRTSPSPQDFNSKLFTLLFRLVSLGLWELLWLAHLLYLPLGFLTIFHLEVSTEYFRVIVDRISSGSIYRIFQGNSWYFRSQF